MGQRRNTANSKTAITLFLCGDVMTGRAIDQVLPHPGDPRLHEPTVRDARGYVRLAEAVNGSIGAPVDFAYIWGDALAELERQKPDIRLINLETAVTDSDDHWPAKGIHYRMHPRNLPAIRAAAIHCCTLANNHVLDWGYRGLAETLQSLRRELGPQVPLCLVLGADAYAAFLQWHKPLEIIQLAHLVVMQRPGHMLPDDAELQAFTGKHLATQAQQLAEPAAGRILLLPVTQLEISSSDIRQRIKRGAGARYLLPEAVGEIITRENLYGGYTTPGSESK